MSNAKKGPNGLDRLKVLLGTQAVVAEKLELTEKQVSRIATGKSPVPPYMTMIAELLETLPHKDWPKRWRR